MLPQEINQTLEDFSHPYRFHVVTIENGIPITYSLDPISLARWVPKDTTEIVGVFESPGSGRALQKSLEDGTKIFANTQD
jgi:hypothetical protein